MQCPPTRPGLNLRMFHLVPAASSTSLVSSSGRHPVDEIDNTVLQTAGVKTKDDVQHQWPAVPGGRLVYFGSIGFQV